MAYIRKRGSIYYFQYVDGNGNKREEKGCRDKKATESMAREAEVHAAKVRLGQANPIASHQKTGIEEHLAEYLGFLRSGDCSPKHLSQTETRLRAVISGVGAERLCELDAVKVAAWLESQRQPTVDPETEEKIPGMSAQTSNHYLTRLRSFVRWAVDHRRLAFDPLTTLKPLNVKLDPRHARSVLSRDEFETLIRSTMASGVFRKLTGEDRAMLYVTAAYTGLRASELASLTVGSIVIDERQATIHVKAAHTKNREKAAQPIHPHLAKLLRAYLEGIESTELIWAGPWWKRAAFILEADLTRAGLSYVEKTGNYRDFHALRHRFGTELARAGVSPKVAQTLMRHSSINLTMDLYANHMEADDQTQALEKLPQIPAALPMPPDHINDRFAALLPHDSPGQSPTVTDNDSEGKPNGSNVSCPKSLPETVLSGNGREVSECDGKEAPAGFEPAVEVLQTSALPLGDGAGGIMVAGSSGMSKAVFGPSVDSIPAYRRAHDHHTTRLGVEPDARNDGVDNGPAR